MTSTFSSFDSDLETQGILLQDWGLIAANFMRDQWICFNFLIKVVGIPESVEDSQASETLRAALSCSVEALALLPSDLVLPVLSFMESVLPQVSLRIIRMSFKLHHSVLTSGFSKDNDELFWLFILFYYYYSSWHMMKRPCVCRLWIWAGS